MNYILPSEADLVQYTLRSSLGILKISAPLNWDDDEKVFKRSESVHGVFISLSNNLEFPRGDENNNGGYDYLVQLYKLEGINANCLLVKEEDLNGDWVESYRGYLDFSTFSRQNNIAKIKFNESGLYEKIKARQSEEIELNRETTLDGDIVPPLETKTVELKGREILIVTKLEKQTSTTIQEIPSGDNKIFLYNDYNLMSLNHEAGENHEAICIPIKMVGGEVDGNVASITDYDIHENTTSYENGTTTGTMFYDSNNNVELDIDININLEVVSASRPGILKLDLIKFTGGENFIYNEANRLTLDEMNGGIVKGGFLSYQNSSLKVQVEDGDSLCLAVHSTVPQKYGAIVVKTLTSDIVIKDPTFYETSNAQFIFPHEAIERTIHIITGEESVLRSNALGRTDIGYELDGEDSGAFTGLTNGFYVRGFNVASQLVDGENMTTSFKDAVESFETTWQLGYGIEKIGLKEYLKMEKIDYFYQNEVTIKIGQPNNIKRDVASDYFYSSLTLGYDKPSGDNLYEEAMGLDEYNIEGSYITPITRVENKFEKKSKYRADSYGTEFARRKPRLEYPETDTRYDKDIMLLDLKRSEYVDSIYEQRLWADDFVDTTENGIFATGVYSSKTATNIRLSPLNCLLRWGFWIKCGLDVYKDKYIRYTSTEGNSNLKTQLIGSDNEYAENGEILIDDLDKSIFVPEYIEFEYPLDTELLMNINSTSINKKGEKIMNYYGMVEFINEDGLLEYGFLMELKPNGNGSWKLLKANKKSIRKSVLDEVIAKPPKPEQSGFNYELNHEIDG